MIKFLIPYSGFDKGLRTIVKDSEVVLCLERITLELAKLSFILFDELYLAPLLVRDFAYDAV